MPQSSIFSAWRRSGNSGDNLCVTGAAKLAHFAVSPPKWASFQLPLTERLKKTLHSIRLGYPPLKPSTIHVCLDKGYDFPRSTQWLNRVGFIPHVLWEKKVQSYTGTPAPASWDWNELLAFGFGLIAFRETAVIRIVSLETVHQYQYRAEAVLPAAQRRRGGDRVRERVLTGHAGWIASLVE